MRNRIYWAIRRHMPTRPRVHDRAVERAFMHGYHAGHHDALGEAHSAQYLDGCELWLRLNETVS